MANLKEDSRPDNMEFKAISDYIRYLVDTAQNVPVLDFLKVYTQIEGSIGSEFISKLHALVTRTDCCVPSELLIEFGIVCSSSPHSGVSRILTRNQFVEGRDYRAIDGPRLCWQFLLKPRTFKTLLLRSQRNPQYIQYYLLLEEAIVHYNNYQLELAQEYIINFQKRHETVVKAKDAQIGSLEEIVRRLESKLDGARVELKADIKEVKDQNAHLARDLGVVKKQNAELKTTLDMVGTQTVAAAREVHEVADQLSELGAFAALPAENHLTSENLLVVRLNHTDEFNFQVIRRQTSNLNGWITRLRRQNPQMEVLLDVPGVPNARSLWARIQDRLGDRIEKCRTRTTRFRLAGDLTEGAFIALARQVYEEPIGRCTGAAKAAKNRVEAIVQNVTQQVIATLTVEDFELLGL